MPFSEITDGPKIPDASSLARMTGSEYRTVRGVSPERLAGITDLFRKISSPQIQKLFREGIALLVQEAKKGGHPEVLANQLSQLLNLVADKTHFLTDQEYTNALVALQDLISESVPTPQKLN